MQGAQFENSILTGATFGKDRDGNWANLKVSDTQCMRIAPDSCSAAAAAAAAVVVGLLQMFT
jgi:hypothetical protein